jgi:Flp pilus assembly pilin Flp
MKKLVKRFIKEENGLETIEWTLMAALVVLGFVVLYNPIVTAIQGVFTKIVDALNPAPPVPG